MEMSKPIDRCCACNKEVAKDLHKSQLGRCNDCYKDMLNSIREAYVDMRGESK